MTRVIVTGASGFVGRHLTEALINKGIEVWAIVRNSQALSKMSEKLHIVKADFTQYEDLHRMITERGFDACFHLAWNGTWGKPFGDYYLQLMNAKYACDMLMQCSQLQCQRFVLSGTIVQLEAQQYMNNDLGVPRTSCIYGMAKNAAALLCRVEAEQLGVEWNNAILSSVYGIGDTSNMIENVLIKSFLSGIAPKLIEGNNYYDCTYVDDVVSGLITLAERGKRNRSYYVGHRELRTFRQIVKEFRDILAPNVSLKFGEYPDTTPIDYSLIDTEALYRDTGFEAATPLKEGLLKTAAWLREREALQ